MDFGPESIRQLLPHYVVLILLLMVVVTALRAVFPGLGFWVTFVIALLVSILYPFATRALGVAPEPWQR